MNLKGLPKMYAFDADDTLSVAAKPGPVGIADIIELKQQGNIVGVVGDWRTLVQRFPAWHQVFSFIGPVAIVRIKPAYLEELRKAITATEYIMFGNVENNQTRGMSDDWAARSAGWRFIEAYSFSRGAR